MPSVRLFSPVVLQPGCRFTLDGGQSRYLTRALRLRKGDSLTLFDGSGGEYPATLVRVHKDAAEVETGEYLERSVESPMRIWLVQGVSKGDRMDKVVQKVTELGVTRITPVLTDRSVVRLDATKALSRRDHWQKIARSACEQCGRNVVPCVDEIGRLSDWHDENPGSELLRLVLKPGAPDTLASTSQSDNNTILLVGPEGGFSDEEYSVTADAGFTAVSLGPRVLRTETAAIAAVTAIQVLWGDLAVES